MPKCFFFIILFSALVFSQENKDSNAFEVSLMRGNVLPHTQDLYHLQGHSDGVFMSFLKQTHGEKEWHSVFNYPDYGIYVMFQDYHNSILGKVFATGGQYNFYFLKRNLELKLGQGMSMTTNPYDKVENSKNKAFGTKFMANTNIGLFFKKENIVDKIGFQAGFLFTHCSNGRIKSPNSGINSYLFNLGLNYNFDNETQKKPDTLFTSKSFAEPIKYNFVIRSGINESPIVRSGQKPFYHISFYADKRYNRKSAVQLGTELFLTYSNKEYIKFKSVVYPELNIKPDTDFKRIGVFAGYEMFINKVSLEAQLGYYIYSPFKNDVDVYDRVGFNYHISKKVFANFAVKTHLFLAEALEFGVGVRL